jgi:hypothetical protein
MLMGAEYGFSFFVFLAGWLYVYGTIGCFWAAVAESIDVLQFIHAILHTSFPKVPIISRL